MPLPMMWFAELLSCLLWTSTEGVLRFDIAMITVVLNVRTVWRLVECVSHDRSPNHCHDGVANTCSRQSARISAR